MAAKVTNNAYGTLSAGITNTATTLTLNSGEGARFPALGAGDYFYATLVDTSNNLEIIKVTARSVDSMTIVRGQDGTTARAYGLNDRLELRPVAALFNEKVDLETVTTVARGGTGKNTLTANSLLVGNGTSAVNEIAPGTAGNVLTSNGSGWTSQSLSVVGRLIGYQVFTSSGTYTKATNNPSFVIVEVVGGGGKGGNAAGAKAGGGGGGGGGYTRTKILATSLASSETVTVGGEASTSSFGAFCSATGGSNGTAGVASNGGTNGGLGGTGSGGDINLKGADGHNAHTNSATASPFVGGNGGSSIFGGGGRGGISNTNGTAAGANSGSGGGGGGINNAGGAGGSGIVIVWEYK